MKYLALVVFAFSLCGGVFAADNMVETNQSFDQEQVVRLGTVVEAIRQLYVDKKNDKELIDHALEGMLADLDPHSAYLDKDEVRALSDMTEGGFSGIGVEIEMKRGMLQVVSPLDGSPASKAGVKPGDLIVKVDGKVVRGMKVSQIIKRIRGPKGSTVMLTILRKGKNQPLVVAVKRDDIKLNSVRSKVLAPHYGYIRISSFQSNTGDDVLDAIKQLKKDTKGELKGVVVDLRNNPGGVLQAAVAVSDAFLDVNKIGYDHKVVYTKGRMPEGQYTGYVSTADKLGGVPIVVLINNGSASAAEIVAGALQDHHRALIVGTRSFGKGSVQTVFPMKDGTAIKLTTARYYTPAGRAIQAKGIEPDVAVKEWKIPDTIKVQEGFDIREEGLDHHLNAENEQQNGQDDKALLQQINSDEDKTDKKDLIYRDYQLHQALTLLRALTTITTNQAK